MVGALPVIPVEFFPQLPGDDGEPAAGSEQPRTAPGQTNAMAEDQPEAKPIQKRFVILPAET